MHISGDRRNHPTSVKGLDDDDDDGQSLRVTDITG